MYLEMKCTMCSQSGSNRKRLFCFNMVDWDPKNMLCYCSNCWGKNCFLCHQDNAHLQFLASTKYGQNSTNFLDTRSLKVPTFVVVVWNKSSMSTWDWRFSISSILLGINKLVAFVNKHNDNSSSYTTFLRLKYVVTNRMVLNFGSSIKANILWPRFLSNACKRKEKVEKHL